MIIEAYVVWYADGSHVFNDWKGCPDTEVQCVILYHPDGYRTIEMGLDEYSLEGHVKYGSLMPEDSYSELIDRALAG